MGTVNEAGTPFEDLLPGAPPVRGVLHRPAGPRRDGLVLTHGAGSDCHAPLLATLARAFAARGLTVLRCDLPFRQARRAGPPRRGSGAADRAGLRRAAAVLRAQVRGRVFVGGHSYGGRQASLLAADEPAVADALLLLAYPLHPPGRPADLRTAHFPRLRTPALFAHGTRDPFGATDEVRAALALVSAPAGLVMIEGAGHALTRGRSAAALATATNTIVAAFLAHVASTAQ